MSDNQVTHNPKWEEQILVTPRAEIFGENDEHVFQGLLTDKEKVDSIMESIAQNIEVRRRGDKDDPSASSHNMEINENYKQPIPYAIITRGDEVFLYERLKGGGEKRLHNQLSIGVGGHMNDLNGDGFNEDLWENLRRELSEELVINSVGAIKINTVGLINDEENEVGRVHIGLLVMVTLPVESMVEVREKEQLDGSWVRIKDLRKTPLFENLEAWSQIAVEALDN
jgi:predicted NUDIX family phosphoesterase